MGEDNSEVVTVLEKQENNNEPIKTGFALFPGNINKKGRPPKGHSITETIKSMMDEKPEIKKALAGKALEMALGGDITAIKTIWGYLDGVPNNTNVAVGVNVPITIGEEVSDDQLIRRVVGIIEKVKSREEEGNTAGSGGSGEAIVDEGHPES